MWKRVPRHQVEQVFHIEVPTIGDILEITVIEPFPGAASAGRLFPTLYLLDSRLTLDIVAGTKRLFDIFSGGALPRCYLVAIGYANPDIAARRFRDYTPTKADLPPGLSQPLPFGTGGAAAYLDALCGEIIPHLERQYPLDPRERVLVGYSLSGRFATYTLFSEPEAFGRYLIISPSLWWDRGSAFAEEEAWETPGGGWRNNLPDEIGLPLKQLTNMRELDRRLSARNYPSLRFKAALIPEGRHVTVLPAAVALGLVELFAL